MFTVFKIAFAVLLTVPFVYLALYLFRSTMIEMRRKNEQEAKEARLNSQFGLGSGFENPSSKRRNGIKDTNSPYTYRGKYKSPYSNPYGRRK